MSLGNVLLVVALSAQLAVGGYKLIKSYINNRPNHFHKYQEPAQAPSIYQTTHPEIQEIRIKTLPATHTESENIG